MAVAALIVALPSALLATVDLAQRMKVAEKLGRLIQWARRRKQESPETSLTVRLPSGKVQDLDRVARDVMLEEAAMAERDRR